MQYTSKSLDAAIEKFAPHTKISKPGRTTALTMAIVEAFLIGGFLERGSYFAFCKARSFGEWAILLCGW